MGRFRRFSVSSVELVSPSTVPAENINERLVNHVGTGVPRPKRARPPLWTHGAF